MSVYQVSALGRRRTVSLNVDLEGNPLYDDVYFRVARHPAVQRTIAQAHQQRRNSHSEESQRQRKISQCSVSSTQSDVPDTLSFQYVDFHPAVTENQHSKTKKQYIASKDANFTELVELANQWLQRHPDAKLFTVETVTWYDVNLSHFLPNDVINYRNRKSNSKTYEIVGLRLWYISAGIEYSIMTATTQQLSFTDHVINPSSGVTSAVDSVNHLLSHSKGRGKVLRLQTLHQLQGKPSECCFSKQVQGKDLQSYSFLRCFVMTTDDAASNWPALMIQDFTPETATTSWSALQRRASQWFLTHRDVTLVNVQTMPALASDPTAQQSSLRLVLSQHRGPASHSLTSRLFEPRCLTGSDVTYEGFSSLQSRVSKWLIKSGACMCGIETLSTSWQHTTDDVEQSLAQIQLYLHGHYKNVDDSDI